MNMGEADIGLRFANKEVFTFIAKHASIYVPRGRQATDQFRHGGVCFHQHGNIKNGLGRQIGNRRAADMPGIEYQISAGFQKRPGLRLPRREPRGIMFNDPYGMSFQSQN